MEFQCWFCEQGIEQKDAGAVMITVESLWRWAEESQSDDDPVQSVYAHSHCAKAGLKGATMDIEPSIFGEDDNPRLQ
jgi:hypothetical protein